MRKYIKVINMSILIILSIFMLSCVRSKDNKDDKEIKIGVTLYREDDVFISTISNNLEEIIKENSDKYDEKIILEVLDAKGNIISQGNQVDKFINQKYDVICVNLVDRTAAATIIDKAKAADIPVIFFNREPVEEDMNRWDKVYYVGTQAEESAKLQAEIVKENWASNTDFYDKNKDGIIQYVMLEGEPGHQDSLIRTEYCIKYLINNDLQLEKLADDTANWQSNQANSKMIQWIDKFGDSIEVVFSNNDSMALGALHAINLNSDKLRTPIVVGVDGIREALEEIKLGNMNGTVISDSRAQAEGIFKIAMDIIEDGVLNNTENIKNNKYMRLKHTKVTLDNVDLYLEDK